MDVNTAPREELVRLVYELMDRITVLETENAHLRERLHQKETGNTKPSLPIKPNVPGKKQGKKKQRKEAYTRKREMPTERIFHAATLCPDCKGPLGKPTVISTRQVIDIPISSYTVTEHVLCKRWCYRCKTCVLPAVDWKHLAFGHRRIGLNLASVVVTMRERLRLPIDVIRVYLRLVYKLTLSHGEIIELLHAAAGKGKPQYENLRQQLLKSPVIHGDETGGGERTKRVFWELLIALSSCPFVSTLPRRKSRRRTGWKRIGIFRRCFGVRLLCRLQYVYRISPALLGTSSSGYSRTQRTASWQTPPV